MTTANFKTILRRLFIIGVLALLLCSLAACKKKPVPTEPSTTPEPSSSVTETTGQTEPGTTAKPTETTAPPETTGPAETTSPTETTAVACEHILGTWKVEKTSTCTTEGSRYKECILCEQKVEEELIPTTAHVPGEWIVDKAATCTAEGMQHQNCTQCDATLIYVTIAKAHQIQTIPGYPATPEKPGMTYGEQCKLCNEILVAQQVIPATGSQSLAYTINSDNKTCTISGLGTYSSGTIDIPTNIANYKVTAIGDNTFAGNKNITGIRIPNTVTKIGAHALQGCSGLTSITYSGTKEQWFTITKGTGWNDQTGNYTIICTDGNITNGN